MIEITYSTVDMWAFDDPDMNAIQTIVGTIESVYEDDDGEHAAEIGTIRLSKINLGAVPYGYLPELLDYTSADWAPYAFVDEWIGGDGPEDFEDAAMMASSLVIVDRMYLDHKFRGDDLGLHIVARALLTWADENSIVLLTASPTEQLTDWEAGCAKLAKHWSQLGLTQHPDLHPPVLYGSPCYVAMHERLKALALRSQVAA